MGNFKAFMKSNAKVVENATLKLERFSEAIVLRPLTSGESDTINDQSFTNKSGRRGRQERVFDVVKYNRGVCAASIIFPDLNDVELQESYGVRGAENLYSIMFLLGESTQILEKVTDISGLDIDINDDIEEAKN